VINLYGLNSQLLAVGRLIQILFFLRVTLRPLRFNLFSLIIIVWTVFHKNELHSYNGFSIILRQNRIVRLFDTVCCHPGSSIMQTAYFRDFPIRPSR